TEATRFAYRRITKTFIGTVMLQLADEGLVEIDEPVSSYLTDIPGGDDITVEHLAAMCSGLENYLALEECDELFSADPARAPEISELLEIAYAASPVFAPGEAYQYSTTNTLLLAEVIEHVTGEPWERAVAERVTEPLGLRSVRVGLGDDDLDAVGVDIAGGSDAG